MIRNSLILLCLFLICCNQQKKTNKIIDVKSIPDKVNLLDTSKNNSVGYKIEYVPLDKDLIVDTMVIVSGIKYSLSVIMDTLQNAYVKITNDEAKETYFYRDMIAKLMIKKGDEILYNNTFKKNSFKEIQDTSFLNQAVVHKMWFDGYDEKESKFKFSINICKPDTDWGYFFNVYVDLSGGIESKYVPEDE